MAMNDELYNDKDPFVLHIVNENFEWDSDFIDYGEETSEGFCTDPLTILERREECQMP